MNSCTTTNGSLPSANNLGAKNIRALEKNDFLDLKKRLLKIRHKEGFHNAILSYMDYLEGDFLSLEQNLTKVKNDFPHLMPYFEFFAAKSLFKQKNHLQAKTIVESLLSSSLVNSQSLRLKATYLLSQIVLKEKNYHRSVELNKKLLKLGFTQKEQILTNLAFSLEQLGMTQEANDVYKELLVLFPSLSKKGLPSLHLSFHQLENSLNNLIKELKYNEAVAKIEEVLKENYSDEEKASLYALKAKSLVYGNELSKAYKFTEEMVKKDPTKDHNLMNSAYVLGKVNRNLKASKNYLLAYEKGQNNEHKAKACFFAGFSLYEANLYPLALMTWEQCKSIATKTNYQEDILWYEALSYLMMEHYPQAKTKLQKLCKNFTKSEEYEKYEYFLAYSQEHGGEKELALKSFKNLAENKQPSYYSLLAKRKLQFAVQAAKKVAPNELEKLAQNSKLKGQKQNAQVLISLGLYEEAKEMVESSNLSIEEKFSLMQALGDYNYAWKHSYLLGSKFLRKNNHFMTNRKIRASFPVPHREIVNNASQKYFVPRSLIHAIMKAESGFFTYAKSHRGALGLMQVMPTVAQDLILRVKKQEYNQKNLCDPKVNIELGSLMLGMLKRQFAKPFLVVAGYNAGAHSVQKWLDGFGKDLSAEIFIERIPFKQTRDYVKKVLLNESLYFALTTGSLRLLL